MIFMAYKKSKKISQEKQRNNKGQSMAEYVIIAGLIALVIGSMGTGFRRSIQRVFKEVADNLSWHSEGEQASDPEKGYMKQAVFTVDRQSTKTLSELSGVYTRTDTETTKTETASETFLGFQKDNP